MWDIFLLDYLVESGHTIISLKIKNQIKEKYDGLLT